MKRIVIGSTHANSGKTSLIIGYGKQLAGKIGYLKPFGDRPVYRKKRLWDTDVSLLTRVFSLHEDPEAMVMGFDHSKLRFSYTDTGIRDRLCKMAEEAEAGKDTLVVEAGSDLFSGASLGLDPFVLSRILQARCFIVVAGRDDDAVDKACFLGEKTDFPDSLFGGVIFNKVSNPEEFRKEQLPIVEQKGISVAGIVPDKPALRTLTIRFLAENLFMKPLADAERPDLPVDSIFLGAMSAGEAGKLPAFQSKAKLVITSGDHSDLILAAIESGASGILLADDISPGADLVARAGEKGIPLFLASCDLFELARQVERLSPLPAPGDHTRLDLLKQLVSEGVRFED